MRHNTTLDIRSQLMTPPIITPEPVRTYLHDNGWQSSYFNEGEFFTRVGEAGYYTYSEAVACMMVKYFTLQEK